MRDMNFIEKKRQSCEPLLKNMEEMVLALRNDDYDALILTSVSIDEIARSIAIIDEEMKTPINPPFSEGDSSFPPLEKGGNVEFEPEVAELLMLINKITDLNQSLITIVADRKNIVGKKLASLNRGAEIAAQYGRMGVL